MRLIHARTYQIEQFFNTSTPRYAILSHTWESEEVSFGDMQDLASAKRKRGFTKIRYTCEQARKNHLEYAWVDTCCIDKSSSAELQEAINSMYSWYKEASICYVYLEDILGSCPEIWDSAQDDDHSFWKQSFARCKWFQRGWTLQELIAPERMVFYGFAWNLIGSKLNLYQTLSDITKVDKDILYAKSDLSSASVAQKLSWAARRKTSRVEDRAYSLLGIFNVNIPLLYGEGENAFRRLQDEILRTSGDLSILAWTGDVKNGRLFAESPDDFADAHDFAQLGRLVGTESLHMTHRDLIVTVPTLGLNSDSHDGLAVLNCRSKDGFGMLALRVRKYPHTNSYHIAASEPHVMGSHLPRLQTVDLRDVFSAPSTRITITREIEMHKRQVTCVLQLYEGSGRLLVTHERIRIIALGGDWWRTNGSGKAIMRKSISDSFTAGVRISTRYTMFNIVLGAWLSDSVATTISGGNAAGIRAIFSERRSEISFQAFLDSWDPCRHGVTCSDPTGRTCPYMSPSVTVSNDRNTVLVTAKVEPREVYGELVCDVHVYMTEMHQGRDLQTQRG